MDKETIIKYSPFAVVAIALIFQWNLFVTPEKLEITHREILQEVAKNYTTKEQSNDFKTQLNDMQKKLDRIYDIIVLREK